MRLSARSTATTENVRRVGRSQTATVDIQSSLSFCDFSHTRRVTGLRRHVRPRSWPCADMLGDKLLIELPRTCELITTSSRIREAREASSALISHFRLRAGSRAAHLGIWATEYALVLSRSLLDVAEGTQGTRGTAEGTLQAMRSSCGQTCKP